MNEVKVSVCIPTWNGAAFVSEALESALAQTWRDFELLVVDDASDDRTLEVAGSFHDPRLRIHRNPTRLGIPGNWNRCLQLAQGEYVKFLFQDDTLFPAALVKLKDALARVPDAVLAFSQREIRWQGLPAESTPYLDQVYPRLLERFYASLVGPVSGADLVKSALRQDRDPAINVVGEPSFVLLWKQAALDAGGFDPRFAQLADWDLWLRMGLRGSLVFVDESLGTFRVHPAGYTVSHDRRLRTSGELVKLIDRLSRDYSHALTPDETRRLRRARWRHRRRFLAETLRRL